MLKCQLFIFYIGKLTWQNASVFQHNLMLHTKNDKNYEHLELCEAGSTGGPDIVCVTKWIY